MFVNKQKMGEYIYNVQEKIEIENGQVLKEREKSMSNFIGLGPPDICILLKNYEPPKFVPGLKSQKISSYHYVTGLNTGSISAAAVYLGSLLDHQEKSSFGRGIYKIDLCHLVSYNAFLKMDLHIELPGTSNHNSPPTTYSLNALGEKNQLEDTFWIETYISSVLRFIQGPTPYLRPVKILPNLLKSPDDESEFLKLCQQHFWQGRKLGSYDNDLYIDFNSSNSNNNSNSNYESMEIDDSNNLLVSTISKYFKSRNRFSPMLSFFQELYKTEPTVSVPVSIATRLLGNIDESISILEKSLGKSPDSISILIELANAYLFKNNKDQSPSPINNLNSPIVTSTTSSNNSSPTTTTTTNTTATTTTTQSVPLSNSTNLINQSSTPKEAPVVNEVLIKALKYILKALSLKPGLIEAWEIAAKILIAMGYHEWALIFLNNTPNVQLDHSVDRVGRGQYQKVTPAQENPNIISVLEDEEIEFDEEPGEESLKRLSSNSLSGDSKKYFKILVGLLKKIGWIQLVDKKNKIIDELAVALRDKHKKEVNSHTTITNSSNIANTSHGNTSGTGNTSNTTLKKSTGDSGSNEIGGDKNANGSGVNISKDGHNTTSPTIKTTQATENTLNNSTDNATVTNNTNTDNSESASTTNNQPIDNEPNVPTQVLWRDEDVTSDGSDIGEDELDKIDLEQGEDGSSSQTTTETNNLHAGTVAATQETKPKVIRKQFDENSLSSTDNLSEILSTFIDDFGSDSLNVPTSADKKYLTFDIAPCFNKVRLPVSYSNRNLDLAFHALFQDVKAFQSWKEEEEQKKVSDSIQISLKHINPHRSIADWTRIGKLAYRIGELGDSEKLFLKLLAEDKSHPHAILGLIKIFTDHGDIRNCLISSSQLSKYYSFKYKTLEIHPVIERSILNLISIHGLQKVRNIFATLPDNNNNLISGLFLDSVKWNSFGYSK